MKLVTGKQMQQLDHMAIKGGIPSLTLMENAGRGIVDTLKKYIANLDQKCVLVVAGKGNNGGDGMVVARLLKAQGITCEVACFSKPADLSPESQHQIDLLQENNIDITYLLAPHAIDGLLARADIVVDALLGVGIKGDVRLPYREVIEKLNQCEAYRVAVDVPSGLDVDTGNISNVCVQADLTVSMGLPKVGLLFYPGKEFVGQLEVVDIGYPTNLVENFDCNARSIGEDFVKQHLPGRQPSGHKGTFGRVCIVAGSKGMMGAALLSTQSALRSGAGLVHLAYPESLDSMVSTQVWEALKHPMPEGASLTEALESLEEIIKATPGNPFAELKSQVSSVAGILGEAALDELLKLTSSMDAVAIGPGIGRDASTQRLVLQLIEKIEKPLVIDADGINALGEDLSVLKFRKETIILTPHPGEFSRLSGHTIQEIASSPIELARSFAVAYKIVLVLKGAPTVVALPEGDVYVNTTGNAGLAKGGSGDVLTGLITSLCAQGMTPWAAACAGVWIHGRSADFVKATHSERTMLPSDVIEAFSDVFLELE